MSRFYSILLLCILSLTSYSHSPQKAPPRKPEPVEVGENDIVRVDTTLVGVPVTVMDRDGRFVSGLKQEDFHIYEDGVEQQVTYFAPVDSNVTALLLFDNSVAKNISSRITARRQEHLPSAWEPVTRYSSPGSATPSTRS